MSVDRNSRSVAIPSLRQLLLVAAGVGAVYLFLREPPPDKQTDLPPTDSRSLQTLQTIEALVREGSEGIPELVSLLSSDDPYCRRLALYGLQSLHESAVPALDEIRKRLTDDDPRIRSSALAAFVHVCPEPGDLWFTLAQALDDSDAGIRESAARILDGTNPRRAVPPDGTAPSPARPLSPEELQQLISAVLPMARSERAEARLLVLKIVRQRDRSWDAPDVTAALRELTTDPDRAVREEAIAGILLRRAASVDEVRGWLRHADTTSPHIVGAALEAVAGLGTEASETLPELLLLVEDHPVGNNPRSLIAALRPLKTAARPAVPGLIRCLVEFDSRIATRPGAVSSRPPVPQQLSVQSETISALVEIGAERSEIRAMLKPLLDPRHPDFGRRTAELLAEFDPDEARRLTLRLIHEIERDKSALTLDVLQILCGLGPAAADSVPLLIRLVEHRDPKKGWIEYYSIEALGAIGPAAATAVPCLTKRLSAPEKRDFLASERHAVIVTSLGRIGPAARSALPALLGFLEMPEPPQAGSVNPPDFYCPPFVPVLTALGQIGENSSEVLAAVRRERSFPEDLARRHAAWNALLTLTHDSKDLLPDLVTVLDVEAAYLRLLAVVAIGRIETDMDSALPLLTKALHDDDPWVASEAALLLGTLGPPAAAVAPALREIAGESRNRSPNVMRAQYIPLVKSIPHTAGQELARFSLADAARLALQKIEPSQSRAPQPQNRQP